MSRKSLPADSSRQHSVWEAESGERNSQEAESRRQPAGAAPAGESGTCCGSEDR